MTVTRRVKYQGFTIERVALFDGTALAPQGWDVRNPEGRRLDMAFTTLAAAKAWVRRWVATK